MSAYTEYVSQLCNIQLLVFGETWCNIQLLVFEDTCIKISWCVKVEANITFHTLINIYIGLCTLTYSIVFDVFLCFCHFHIYSVSDQVWYQIVSIPDLRLLPYY